MSKKIKFGVVAFPGSNCDEDCVYVLRDVIGCEVTKIWHKEASVGDVDAICLPGGFSYGDYLRTGAIARFSPVMKDVVRFANAGKPVIGICNGFQILLESGLLPGAMLRNRSLLFECRTVNLKVENTDTLFTKKYSKGQVIRVPIAHGEGNYFADPDTIKRIEDNRQVIVRYVNDQGETTDAANPNGSLKNIAGIMNEKRNVFGLMPHPERCSETALGGTDGKHMFLSIVESLS